MASDLSPTGSVQHYNAQNMTVETQQQFVSSVHNANLEVLKKVIQHKNIYAYVPTWHILQL